MRGRVGERGKLRARASMAWEVLHIQHDRQITPWAVKSLNQKYFALPEFGFAVSMPPSRAQLEGRFAIVTIRWAQDAMDAAASGGVFPPDVNAAVYGEIVWSWRRDPGVYPARLCGLGNGDNKGRSPGRARISRKAIARGRPGCLGCTCQTRVRSYYPLHTVMRAQSAPGFPCALCLGGSNELAKLRRKSRRENESVCPSVVANR